MKNYLSLFTRSTADATPLYLITLHEAWRWTGDLDQVRRVGRRRVGHRNPVPRNSTANNASIRITTVMEVTTEDVVRRPRLSVLGCTRMPKWQATSAIRLPKTTPLPRPIQ